MSQHDQRQATASATSRPTVLDVHGYKVGKTLGHGSYATVKESYSSRHKCKVAIKIISKRRAPGDYLDKFLPREIDVVKLLKHPNLVVFLQSIETNNRVYLIMENASGGDLLDTIRSEKYIQEKQAGVWFDQLIEGIKYCHAKGVVHRDLKCENLLLDEYKNLKVTDFGFARSGMIKSEGSDPPLSETYCGSYAYAAPEILTGTPYVPQHADVWSCGIILYVMVFGRLPFDDSNHKKLLKQVHKGPVFPENRPVSNECKDVIRRILVKCDVRLRIPEIQAHPWYVKIDKKVVPNEESFLHQLRLKRAQDAKREKEKSEALAAKGTNIANPDGGTVSQTPSQIGGGNGQDAKKTPSDEGEDEGHAKDLHHEHDDGHPHREHSMQQREQPIPQFPGRGSVGGGSGGSGGSSKR